MMLLSIHATAQQKVQDKVVIKTPMAICEECKFRIEAYLQEQDGVISVNVDIKKHTTTVVYLTDRTDDEILKAYIASLGFDADDVPAEESNLRHLPHCCQKIYTPKELVKDTVKSN